MRLRLVLFTFVLAIVLVRSAPASTDRVEARAATVLKLLLALPVPEVDRGDTPEARRALLEPVAYAIALEGDTPLEVGALVAIGWHESRFARYVLEGRCLDGPKDARCDPKGGTPRARGAFQVWAWCHAWKWPVGSPESLRAEAQCAARKFRGAMNRCASQADDVLAGAFSGYRSSHTCSWPGAVKRAQSMRRVIARIETMGLP